MNNDVIVDPFINSLVQDFRDNTKSYRVSGKTREETKSLLRNVFSELKSKLKDAHNAK